MHYLRAANQLDVKLTKETKEDHRTEHAEFDQNLIESSSPQCLRSIERVSRVCGAAAHPIRQAPKAPRTHTFSLGVSKMRQQN